MQVFATFEHSSFVELAIMSLEQNGIKDIFAVPLDNRQGERKIFDTLHRADGVSNIGKGMVLAVIFSVIGASRGFVMAWGPIYWGVIGAMVGFTIGLAIDIWINKVWKKNKRLLKGKNAEIILIVNCEEQQIERVEALLWEHLAQGLAKIR
ncbi:hypothetical protein B5M42_013170 [Paenibacillus athensensis]|uniref:Uncharacterized protein n=1 Tax=Paenibacillus athensensis TaxID=1967502 RepID=A0A4Y8Q7J0_9BACL|nr:hypothetical protein [Paenibacillus athensensis]MCD1259786.1 hypothetical protein [Paenibacillus athensensis]